VNPVFAIAVYFVIWWTVLFAMLPFAGRSQHQDGEIVPGTPPSAPTTPRFLRVILLTTMVSAVVLALLYALFATGMIDLTPPPQPA
jgi:predicted secreted protein